MSLSFIPMQTKHAEMLLRWRTDPFITQFMYTDLEHHDVDKQIAWIETMQRAEDYQGFVVHDAGQPVGFICFSDINQQHQRCSTGSYIYEKQARLKYAATLHTYICNYAFHALGMNKIENFLLAPNKKVLQLQRLHKSTEVGCLREHIYKNGAFHDVYIFEILKRDWAEQKQHYPLAQILSAFGQA
jgi:UDP-4-amino-4,6-dideoxy-N-acetyl-beta-L-altrosamine N-acetyltransferase